MRLKVSTSSEYWEGMSDRATSLIRGGLDHVVGGLDQKLRLRAEP